MCFGVRTSGMKARIAVCAAFSAATTVLGCGSLAYAGGLNAQHVVHIVNFTYRPASVRVRAGEQVRFVNDDDEAHTVTGRDKSFDSAGLDSGGTWEHVFTKPGTYRYFCELHPYMNATVEVTK